MSANPARPLEGGHAWCSHFPASPTSTFGNRLGTHACLSASYQLFSWLAASFSYISTHALLEALSLLLARPQCLPPPLLLILSLSFQHTCPQTSVPFLYFCFINTLKNTKKNFFLQCCVVFCHTTVQISHNYTYTLLPPGASHSPRPSWHQTGPPVPQSNLSPAAHLTPECAYRLMLLSPFIPLSPSPTVSKSPSSTSAFSFPFLQIGPSVPFF